MRRGTGNLAREKRWAYLRAGDAHFVQRQLEAWQAHRRVVLIRLAVVLQPLRAKERGVDWRGIADRV